MAARYFKRILDLKRPTSDKSCFLFGPRQTGKSSLIEHELPDAKVIDLLDDEIYLRLQQNPKDLASYVVDPTKLVVLDEIQRIPSLLNEVHRLIEKKRMRFLLTGSSARKLRKKGVNLLGGRARSRVLHPFVFPEVRGSFDLARVLHTGNIPSILLSPDPWDDLKSYVGNYLKEEIVAEAATRNVPAFSRFLEVAAISNGQMINYEKISNDAQVSRSTVQSYFQILRDTLIGNDLPAYRKTRTRKAIQTHKFYFFDLGVVNYLKRQKQISENSPDFGIALEAYFHHELASYCDYHPGNELSYWRSQSGYEVDFLLNEDVAIEIKATKHANKDDFKGLLALSEDLTLRRKLLVCREATPRKMDGVEIFPIRHFLEELWDSGL
ncbi:MAG: AAA family ATPase [Oligoflexia bacterium]|nr:AAA family ATPase [Oligoflexia bacterium]